MSANVDNSAVATGLAKVSFHSNPKERQCQGKFKLSPVALISHTSKVILKILQARLQHYMNCELLDVQAGFRKGRGTRDQIPNSCWIIKKKKNSSIKTCSFALLFILKPFTVWITSNCGKFLNRWEYQTTSSTF